METPQERGSDSESRSTESQETEDLEDLDCYFLYRTSLKNTVLDVLSGRAGWKETTNIVDWDLNWADTGWIRDHFSSLKLDDTQRINHFKNHYELTRKDLLSKNLKRLKRQVLKTGVAQEIFKLDFFPQTYVLPNDYQLFLEYFKQHPGSTWIMKPVGKAQGKGIFLFTKIGQISNWKKDYSWYEKQGAVSTRHSKSPVVAALRAEAYVVQRYVSNPYVVGGKKFDLRLYVLVTSFSPLKLWIHRLGFARFSAAKYSVGKEHIKNAHMHLTNYAIQKQTEEYKSLKKQKQTSSYKWNLHSLKVYLMMKHGNQRTELLFAKIQDVIVRTIMSVQQIIIQDKHCFELYGFDVLFDDQLKPWLIEVNASPSLTASDDQDKQLKKRVLTDVFDVLDVEGNFPPSEERTRVGGFDLVFDTDHFVRKQVVEDLREDDDDDLDTYTDIINRVRSGRQEAVSFVVSNIGCDYSCGEEHTS